MSKLDDLICGCPQCQRLDQTVDARKLGTGDTMSKQVVLQAAHRSVLSARCRLEPVSRTYGEDRLVDELIISFTHTIRMDHILPGVETTGRRVEAVFVVIVGFDNDKVADEHILWDQASVLVPLGLLDPNGLPVVGAGSVLPSGLTAGPYPGHQRSPSSFRR